MQTDVLSRPVQSTELCDLLDANPQAVLVAGATDVGLWVTKQNRGLDTVIYLGEVDELKQIQDDGQYLSIGAAVSYTDASSAITTPLPGIPVLDPTYRWQTGTQCRHHRRQYRKWFTDRRHATRVDRRWSPTGTVQYKRTAAHRSRGLLHRLRQTGSARG